MIDIQEPKLASRPGIDDYFLGFAHAASKRSTCSRAHVGSAIVVDNQVVATGYNGSVRGMPHCTDPDVGCDIENGHCVRTVHAELNALAQAAKCGVSVNGSSIYLTHAPCWPCFRLLVNAGINRFVFENSYRFNGTERDRIESVAWELDIEVVAVTRDS